MGGGQWQIGGLVELWHYVGHEQRSGCMLKIDFSWQVVGLDEL
jgi:hypothetical protein